MVAVHALVATAAAVYGLQLNYGSMHCDNQGALSKEQRHSRCVKSSLWRGHRLQALHSMKQGLFLALSYKYAKSHQDDIKEWHTLPLDQW